MRMDQCGLRQITRPGVNTDMLIHTHGRRTILVLIINPHMCAQSGTNFDRCIASMQRSRSTGKGFCYQLLLYFQ